MVKVFQTVEECNHIEAPSFKIEWLGDDVSGYDLNSPLAMRREDCVIEPLVH